MISVIGLDGATWPYIEAHRAALPALNYLLSKYRGGELDCDVRPVGSVTSWTTIFTGLTPAEHGLELFVEGKLPDLPWAWKGVESAHVLAVPISRPPVCINVKLPEWREVVWPGSLPAIRDSTQLLVEMSEAILKKKPELFVVVFPAIDRISHILIFNRKVMLEEYQFVDRGLQRLLPLFEPHPFLVLSDHGMAPVGEVKKHDWCPLDPRMRDSEGAHSPHGLIIGNRRICSKVTEVRHILDMLITDERMKRLGYRI